MALPDTILTIINDLKRRVDALERNPQPPNVEIFTYDDAAVHFDAHSHNTVGYAVALPNDGRLLGTPEITVFRDSVDLGNVFPFAPGWTYEEALNFRIHWHFDMAFGDGTNPVLMVFLVNDNDHAIDIVLRVQYRYLQRGAGGA